jgi:hypothetical protein
MFAPNLGKNWTTHMGVLVKVLYQSQGDVAELGAGPFSTPLLHWVCKDLNCRLISYENNLDFYNYARRFQSQLHSIVFVKNWDEIDTQTHRGVAFIDHAPIERRKIDIVRLKNTVDYLVIHDTNGYGYEEEVWPHFRYIYTWKECRPWVSVVSNFKDLSDF